MDSASLNALALLANHAATEQVHEARSRLAVARAETQEMKYRAQGALDELYSVADRRSEGIVDDAINRVHRMLEFTEFGMEEQEFWLGKTVMVEETREIDVLELHSSTVEGRVVQMVNGPTSKYAVVKTTFNTFKVDIKRWPYQISCIVDL